VSFCQSLKKIRCDVPENVLIIIIIHVTTIIKQAIGFRSPFLLCYICCWLKKLISHEQFVSLRCRIEDSNYVANWNTIDLKR
jgi:hypothetical protein